MNLYQKLFIRMSIVYLLLGVGIGLFRSFSDFHVATLNFAHLHLNLLGFMMMIVSGIAYFILPRFNSADLAFPSLQSIHFWSANIGLLLLIIGYGLKIEEIMLGKLVFIIGASCSSLGIVLFSINILITLRRGEIKLKEQEKLATLPISPITDYYPNKDNLKQEISDDILVIDLIEKYPYIKKFLIDEVGLVPLKFPDHLKTIKDNNITLAQAIRTHGKDIPSTTNKINNLIYKNLNKKIIITKDLTVGEVLNKFPNTRVVFEKYFGDGCFTCPGQNTESLEMASSIHNTRVEDLISDLNKVL